MSEYKDKKKMKKLGLLEMSNPAKKVQLIKEVGEKLQQEILEAKQLQRLLEAENLAKYI